MPKRWLLPLMTVSFVALTIALPAHATSLRDLCEDWEVATGEDVDCSVHSDVDDEFGLSATIHENADGCGSGLGYQRLQFDNTNTATNKVAFRIRYHGIDSHTNIFFRNAQPGLWADGPQCPGNSGRREAVGGCGIGSCDDLSDCDFITTGNSCACEIEHTDTGEPALIEPDSTSFRACQMPHIYPNTTCDDPQSVSDCTINAQSGWCGTASQYCAVIQGPAFQAAPECLDPCYYENSGDPRCNKPNPVSLTNRLAGFAARIVSVKFDFEAGVNEVDDWMTLTTPLDVPESIDSDCSSLQL